MACEAHQQKQGPHLIGVGFSVWVCDCHDADRLPCPVGAARPCQTGGGAARGPERRMEARVVRPMMHQRRKERSDRCRVALALCPRMPAPGRGQPPLSPPAWEPSAWAVDDEPDRQLGGCATPCRRWAKERGTDDQHTGTVAVTVGCSPRGCGMHGEDGGACQLVGTQTDLPSTPWLLVVRARELTPRGMRGFI